MGIFNRIFTSDSFDKPIGRGTAIKSIIAGLAGLYSGKLFAGKKGRVIVIGAGVAGLAAARDLEKAGIEAIVVEAQNRIGGRLYTDKSMGVSLDFGASWIHESGSSHPIQKLGQKLNVRVSETDHSSYYMFDYRGKRIADETAIAYAKAADELIGQAAELAESEDATATAALNYVAKKEGLSARQREFLFWRVAALEAAAAEDLGKMGDESEGDAFGDDEYAFKDGYETISNGLARGLKIKKKHLVKKVSQNAKGVTVYTNKGKFKADAALVTVSAGVLKKNKIKFSPGLPRAKKQALSRIGMGTLNKIALKFDRQFWPNDRHFIGYVGKKKGYYASFLNYAHINGAPVLVCFSAGSNARKAERYSDKRVKKEAMAVLKKIFGNKMSKLTGFKRTKWNSNPYTYGSYSHVKVNGTGRDRKKLAEPFERIFFAGEATSVEYPGTVHGAYLSGVKAARELIAAANE